MILAHVVHLRLVFSVAVLLAQLKHTGAALRIAHASRHHVAL